MAVEWMKKRENKQQLRVWVNIRWAPKKSMLLTDKSKIFFRFFIVIQHQFSVSLSLPPVRSPYLVQSAALFELSKFCVDVRRIQNESVTRVMVCESQPTKNMCDSQCEYALLVDSSHVSHTRKVCAAEEQAQSKYLSVLFFFASLNLEWSETKQCEAHKSGHFLSSALVWLIYVLSHEVHSHEDSNVSRHTHTYLHNKIWLEIKVCQKYKTLKIKSP